MKNKILFGVIFILFAAVAWIFFPTTVGAKHEVFAPLMPAQFSRVRGDALLLEELLRNKGVELIAGDPLSQSIQFNCKGVPVLTLINGKDVLSVLTFIGADQRAPHVAEFRKRLYSQLVPSGSSFPSTPVRPGVVEAFVLKQRDGIDLTSDCAR